MYSLIAVWTIRQGKEKLATAALRRLARKVQRQEAGTLIYLAHVPDMRQPSLPTPSNLEVVFFEVYKDKAAFLAHVTGDTFQNFVKEHADLFLCPPPTACDDGTSVVGPFITVKFLERKAGFIRPELVGHKS
jgi:quinol monooxygenase YgiN